MRQRSPLRFVVLATCGVVLVGLASASAGAATPQGATTGSPASIYEHAHASIVVLATVDKDNKPIGQGSGFIVSKDRIVTNHHVLAGASNVLVFFADGESVVVDGIVSDSPRRDLAVISAKTGTRSALRLGDEFSVRQGDYVFAIGAPKGLKLSITNGIVSGFRQVDEQFMIQSTAPIAPGSSGGPLFDNEGRVVGVTTSLLTDAPGIYFSVGAGDVNRLLRTPNAVMLPVSSLSDEKEPESSAERAAESAAIEQLIKDKKYDSAKEQLNPLLARNPEDPNLNRMMGEVNFFQGDNRSALVHLKSTLDKNPQDTEAMIYYAFDLFLVGRYAEAEEFDKSLVKTAPTDFTLGLLAETYYAEKKFKGAEESALSALAKNPEEETSLGVVAGNIYWGRSTSGMVWKDVISKLSNAASNSYWVEVSRALTLLSEKKDSDAIAVLQEAKKNSFPDPAAHALLAYIYQRADEIGLARDAVHDGLDDFPDNPRLLGINVGVLLRSHDYTGAYRSATKLVEVASGSSDELYSTCLYNYGVGQSALAISSCTKLTEVYPNDHTAHSNLGWSALDGDQFTLASQEFAKAYDLVKDKDKWNALTSVQIVDLFWGTAIADYFLRDKKDCKRLLQVLRKNYPEELTVTGLQQLPLIWSNKTMLRIETILRTEKP
jgi:Flp pilus assembly protein TadD